MVIYWLGLVITLLLTHYIKEKNTSKKAIICSVPFAIIAGLRYGVGTDFFSYQREYALIGSGYSTRFEPVFVLFCKALYRISKNSALFFFVTAVIFLFFTFKAVFENSKNIELSVFLIIGTTAYFMFLNGIRQMMACAICFFALKYVKQRRFWRFALLVALAVGIHYSSIAFLPVYFFDRIRVNTKKIIIVFFAVALSSNWIANIINSYISKLDYYRHYLTKVGRVEISAWILINIFIFIFCTLYSDFSDKDFCVLYLCQFITACLSLFEGKVVLLTRFMWIYFLPQLFLIPDTVSRIKNKRTRTMIKLSLVVLYIIYSSYSIGINRSHRCVPYRTIFS